MLKNIEKIVKDFDNDVNEIKKELKRVQSTKCRLKKQKMRKDYESEMTKVVKYEQALKEAKSLLEPKKVTTTTMTQEDVDKLTFEDTIKAIKSIQSKKCLSQYDEDKSEYEDALRIEKMLLDHKKVVQEVPQELVKKTDVKTIIDTLENNDKLSKEKILELLKELI